jgi:hypothetical protein
MNWNQVQETVLTHRCDEQRKYGCCNCRSVRKGAKYNPCEMAVYLSIRCDTPTPAFAADVAKWLKTKCCGKSRADHSCNHRGCIHKEEVIGWVELQAAIKVAA